MRGKRPLNRSRPATGRIIPAHAGQTIYRRSASTCNADHPRACGANIDIFVVAYAIDGSSPRMRGKPQAFDRELTDGRIIPAHAGQTHH